MTYSFDEIMAYHPDNADVYQEIKQFLPKLVPFIGAGLTQFAYCSMPNALKMLSCKLTNSANAQKIIDLIYSKQYLDAAQLLEDFRAPVNLTRDLADIFSADKLEQNRKQLPKEAISLLPYLFPELVLTTNFDETLETVYRESGHPFQAVFLPGHPELLRQLMRQEGIRGLLKLHGTVSNGLIEYEKIVFTQVQYNLHYGKDSPLTRELRSYLENRMMLFLGCSFERDHTMELLQEVIQPGDSYAIICCEPSERDEKIRQLGEKHVRTILYENGRHEAIRVILEHLLEETDPESYNVLPVHMGALKSIDLLKRFSYKAEIVPFTGRTNELQALNTFLGDAHISFRWWAIIGPGGSGKSRLAYEFQKQLPPDWAVHYLDSGDYANLFSLTAKLTQKTLLIADYVQENAKEIGRWMEQTTEKNRSVPIRVLLVERGSGTNETDSEWVKQLYANVHHEQRLKSTCYQENFLVLQPLLDDDLLTIIKNYAMTHKQNGMKIDYVLPDTPKLLLQKLKSIDPVLCRPSYAMFLTEAYMLGHNLEQWNRKDILDYFTEYEQEQLKFNIQQIFGNPDEKLHAACLYLYSMATVLRDASLEELQRLCPDTWTIIQQKSDAFVSPSSMLEHIGLVVKGPIFTLRPDLMSEYFVYTWLLQHPDKVQRFLYSAWQRPAPTAAFFNRIVHDYSHLLNENAKHWESILPNDIPASEDTAWFYAMLLVNATYHCNIAEGHERQINLLKELASGHPMNLNVAVALANGLFNLSTKQDEQNARDTIACLENLAEERPYVPDIAIWLAKGLFDLSTKQDEQGARDTIVRLESLAKEYPYVPDIVITLANGLFNLSTKQDEQGARDTIARLENLAAEHPYVPDIAIWLAKGLFNLSTKQDEQGARDTITRLESLAAEHPDVPDIVIALANGLFNLSMGQDEQSMRDTIARLESLAAEHPDVLDIVIALVRRRKIFMGMNSENSNNTQTTRHIADIAKKPTLFLSYSQKDSSIANIIENQLKGETNDGIKISRYTRVPYKGSFKAFMNSIQEHDFVLCLVSDNYLKSQACMYEVGEIIKDHHFEEKLLFVVIGENDRKYYSDDMANFSPAKIYGNERNRLRYIQYWKSEYEKLEEAMNEIDDREALIRASQELREIGKIYRNDISEFLTYLAQNNGKNFDELCTNRFFDIIKWIYPNWESKVFANCKNMSELLTNAIEEICKATQTDYNQVALCVRVSSHETGLVVYADNVNDRKQRYRLVVMEGLMADSFSTGNIINIGNTKNEPQYFAAVEETKSELVVPIAFLGNIIGVINSESEKEDYYSQEIVSKISCISRDFSIAIKRIGYVPNMRADEIPYIHL